MATKFTKVQLKNIYICEIKFGFIELVNNSRNKERT